MKKYIAVVMLSLALAACNQEKTSSRNEGTVTVPSGLSGTYTSADGKNTWVFSSDGTVKTKSIRGDELVTTYSSEGGKVTFKFPQGYPIAVTVNSDGSLTSDSHTSYRKMD